MEAETGTWLGLVAVILAALLGYGSSVVQESRRRRYEDRAVRLTREREDRRRLQDLRFEAYVAMTTQANRVYAAVKHPIHGVPDVAHVHELYESFMVALSPAFMLAADADSRDV